MKKWLLLSTVIHLLILMITFPQNENKQVDRNIEKIKFVKVNIKLNKNMGTETSSHTFPRIPNISNTEKMKKQSQYLEKTSQTLDEKIETKAYEDEKIIENIKQNVDDVPKESTETENKSLDNVPVQAEKSEEILGENTSNKEEKNSEISIESGTSTDIAHESYDENIISRGLVKENEELSYKILQAPNPSYPFKAQILNLKENVEVVAEFTVDLEGKVKDIQLSSDFSDFKFYNFDKNIKKALKKYRFTPIYYKGEKVEVRFKKRFEFNN